MNFSIVKKTLARLASELAAPFAWEQLLMTLHRFRVAVFLCTAIVSAWIVGSAHGQGKLNILFYGNSFTNGGGGIRSIPTMVANIATAAGNTAPYTRNAAINGQTLQYHLTNNVSVITTGIPVGQSWDAVVLQDYSTWPTHIGNLPQHLSSSLALYQKVAQHSPNVVPVMYETWARSPGHSFYPGQFPGGPAQMQQELRDGYHQSTANINTTVGESLARYAPVGDAWEEAGFPIDFYASDLYHASDRGSLLNSLILYGTIYSDQTTSDIDLTAMLTSLGLSAADGVRLTTLADSVLAAQAVVPEPSTACLVLVSVAVAFGCRRR